MAEPVNQVNSQSLSCCFSCIQHPVIMTDLNGRIANCNSTTEQVFGFRPDELTGRELSIIFTPEDLEYLYPNLLLMAKKGRPFEGEVMLRHKDGTRLFTFMTLWSCDSPIHEVPSIIIYIQNIDDQKRLEKQFSKTSYEDMIKIANGIAHELRNPLVGIGGFVNRLHKICSAVHDHDKYYEYIIENLNKIEGLVKKIHFFANLPVPTLSEISIREVVTNSLQQFTEKIKEKRTAMKVSLEDILLLVDPDLLARSISILVDNSLDAIDGTGEISIQSKQSKDHCTIQVSDTGPGISDEDMKFIFNPFFSTKADGAGVDLAIIKRIMDSHGGSVDVISEQGKGTTFSLHFPFERRRSIRTAHLEENG
ncbi:MAG: PAS domain S-box protein [Deltaproteobacteria bacterium]|nr:PAS domain S-box protein [Deltaproteobacteria bacterium]